MQTDAIVWTLFQQGKLDPMLQNYLRLHFTTMAFNSSASFDITVSCIPLLALLMSTTVI